MIYSNKKIDNKSEIVVFHFLLDPRFGGPQNFVSIIKRNICSDFSHTVFTCGSGFITDKKLSYFRKYNRFLYVIDIIINTIMIILAIIKAVLNGRQVIMHVHGVANVAPLISAILMRQRVIWHIHENIENYGWFAKLQNIRFRRLEIVSVSLKAIDMYNLQNATHVPVCVDFDYWSSDPSVRASDEILKLENFRSCCLNVLCVGNLNPLKGYDLLIHTMNFFKVKVCVRIVGLELSSHKDYAQNLKVKAHIVNAKNNGVEVIFMGAKKSSEVRSLMHNSDVFLLCSSSEACPTVLLEACATGIPIIASDVGDVPDIVQQHPTAKIYNKTDYMKLAQLINDWNTSKVKKLPRKCFLNDKYRTSEVVKKIENIYESILE